MENKRFRKYLLISVFIYIFVGAINIFGEDLKQRPHSKEIFVVTCITTIAAAEAAYMTMNSKYATLEELASAGYAYVGDILSNGEKDGYIFQITVDNKHNNFYITAEPQDLTEGCAFYIDEDGVLCKSYEANTPAPIRHAANRCPAHFKETNLQSEFQYKK